MSNYKDNGVVEKVAGAVGTVLSVFLTAFIIYTSLAWWVFQMRHSGAGDGAFYRHFGDVLTYSTVEKLR